MKKSPLLFILFFTTLANAQTLKSAINEVLSTNPIIQERLKNYNAIKEDITSAKSGYYPKLDLSVGAGIETVKREDRDGITVLQDHNGNKIGHKSLDVYESSLKYTHNLFKGFETTYQVKEQEYRTISAAYSYIEKANDTSFKMVDTYLKVMKNRELLETAKENVKINQDIFTKVQKLYNSGLTTLSEVNKIESSLALAQSNQVVQENTLEDVTFTMQKILGRHIDLDSMNKPELDIILPATIEEATQFAIQNNPSLLVSKYNIKLAQATHQEKKSPFYPTLDVEVSESINKNLSALEGRDDKFRAMAYIRYNFFNGFSDKAALQKSISSIHQEIESKNTLRREVIEGLGLSWAANTKLTQQIVYLKDYKKFSLKTLTLYSKEYDLGRRSLLDLLSAQKDFIGSKSQLINTEYNMLFAKYRILDAMGILVSTVIGNTDNIYSNVGLAGNTPHNIDTLPVNLDSDNDLIADDADICDNSLSRDMKNIYGCKFNFKNTKRIERYSSFRFDNNSAQLSTTTLAKINNLIKQLKPYGLENIKFNLLGNVDSDTLSDKEMVSLSQKRAEAIKARLVEAGAKAYNITLHANSNRAPIFSSDTSDAIDANNRVDIIVQKLDKSSTLQSSNQITGAVIMLGTFKSKKRAYKLSKKFTKIHNAIAAVEFSGKNYQVKLVLNSDANVKDTLSKVKNTVTDAWYIGVQTVTIDS